MKRSSVEEEKSMNKLNAFVCQLFGFEIANLCFLNNVSVRKVI